MCEFKIEKKKYAMPDKQAKRKYPFHRMKVGQSFFVPLKERAAKSVYKGVYESAKSQGFVVRAKQVELGGVEGFRVWMAGKVEPRK